LISEDTADPWVLYAVTPKEVDTKPYIEKYSTDKNVSLDPAILEELLLSDKVKTQQAGIGLECEILLELNAEQETEVEEQIVTDDKKVERNKCHWKPSLNLFVEGWERPFSVFMADKM